jgi:MerR family transcriptional regulator, light-induced transcriptional regulator
MGIYDDFYQSFEKLEQEKCVQLINDALMKEEITVVDLYEKVLRKSMSFLTDVESDSNHKIWKEHIQSGIVRTIIEMSSPFVLKSRTNLHFKRAAVICPDGEQHELGARMVSDYIRIMGYETFFVGRDTPRSEMKDLITSLSLDLIAISVTNYYNLTKVVQMVDFIELNFPNIKIIVGGKGIEMNSELFVNRGIEVTRSFNDIERVLGELA